MSILKIHAREIFDSRGNPTVEVDLHTAKGRWVGALLGLGQGESAFALAWASGRDVLRPGLAAPGV